MIKSDLIIESGLLVGFFAGMLSAHCAPQNPETLTINITNLVEQSLHWVPMQV
jgi:hypothetical protein